MAILLPPPTKPITLPWQRGFSGKGKKNNMLSHVLKGEKWVTGRSGLRLWLKLRISSQGCCWFFKRRTYPSLEQHITWTFATQCPTVWTHKPHCMQEGHACKKAMHAISPCYRTVYIPWLVASYDTHKGKHWLNSDPPIHRGQLKHWSRVIDPTSCSCHNCVVFLQICMIYDIFDIRCELIHNWEKYAYVPLLRCPSLPAVLVLY